MIRQLDFPLSQLPNADRHACRRRPHPRPGQDQPSAQDQDRRPSAGGRAAGHRRPDQDVRRDRGAEHPSGDAAGQARRADRRGGQDSRSASSNWRSGTRPAIPTASFRSAWASCCSAATISIATAAWARSTPITAATSRPSSRSLKRIRASDVEWLLPSHGPIFRKDNALLDAAIARLEGYLHMADFGTCAIDWPLMDEWDDELAAGKMPQ